MLPYITPGYFCLVDLKHLIEAERAKSRGRGHFDSSTSDSYYTDSYLDGSRDEISSSSTSGMQIYIYLSQLNLSWDVGW